MTKFEIGKTYYFHNRFAHTMMPCKVTKRTDKTILIETNDGFVGRFRIDKKMSEAMDSECIHPVGKNPYGPFGAPVLSAKHDKHPRDRKN